MLLTGRPTRRWSLQFIPLISFAPFLKLNLIVRPALPHNPPPVRIRPDYARLVVICTSPLQTILTPMQGVVRPSRDYSGVFAVGTYVHRDSNLLLRTASIMQAAITRLEQNSGTAPHV